ncbi:unnamed protein product [Sphagnum jensenii]|uniref:Uncharacterized protein n=1 Tax=Sphagnum jensenii TaxID=128206 RepID=A0ABP0WGB7_9BRYO
MAESSCCSWNCSTNLDRKWCSPPAFMHSGEMMKSLADFVMVRCSLAVNGNTRCVRILTAVAMAAEGHRCDTCAWTLRPGTDVDQHNSGLLHWTLLDASARLTLEEFGRFRERVALDGPKKGRTRLKQVLKATSQGQLRGPGALALWEEPRPLATRDEDAFQALDGLSDRIVTVEEPCDWLALLKSRRS